MEPRINPEHEPSARKFRFDIVENELPEVEVFMIFCDVNELSFCLKGSCYFSMRFDVSVLIITCTQHLLNAVILFILVEVSGWLMISAVPELGVAWRCVKERFYYESAIEHNHYFVRSFTECVLRRNGELTSKMPLRYEDRGPPGPDVYMKCFKLDIKANECEAPSRIFNLVRVGKALRAMPWPERLLRYHLPRGGTSFCIRNYATSGEAETCRPHFLSAIVTTFFTDDFLLEWLDFHTVAGFDHFHVFDGGNSSATYDLLQDYILHGVVTYHRPFHSLGDVFLQDAVIKLRTQPLSTFWLSYIDLDETMYPRQILHHWSIRDFLLPLTTLRESGPRFFHLRYHAYGTSRGERPQAERSC